MFFTLTSVINFLGMGVSLWMAFYLLGHGFSNRVSLRGAVVLVAIAAFFLVSYMSLYTRLPGVEALKAILLTISFCVWNDLTHKLLSTRRQRNRNWLLVIIYASGFVTIVLLVWSYIALTNGAENSLQAAQMEAQPPYILAILFQLFASVCILYGVYRGAKLVTGQWNRYFVAASLLAVTAASYGVLTSAFAPSAPSLIQNVLIFSSMFVFGISVEYFQAEVERHTAREGFVISSLAVFWLSAIYIVLAWRLAFPPITLILVAALSILTHSSYNLLREFLQRLQLKDEATFRHQLGELENNIQAGLPIGDALRSGLKLLCEALNSDSAFVALRDEDRYIVIGSYNSLEIGFTLPSMPQEPQSNFAPPPALADRVAWLAPAFQAGRSIVLLGIGKARGRVGYSDSDLNLMLETANRIAVAICLQAYDIEPAERFKAILAEAQLSELNPPAKSDGRNRGVLLNPDPYFIKLVEEGLRNLSDFITLGQSSLPEYFGIDGTNQIEQGKAVQQILLQAIEVLRPSVDCPPEPFPREWYSYIILHDAYHKQVPNHDIMSKLYISEGTFHRTRRAAVRAVAHALLEMRNDRRK